VGGCVGVSVRVGSMGWLGRAWGASEGAAWRAWARPHTRFSPHGHAPLRHWCWEKNTLDQADAKRRSWVLRPGLGAWDKRCGCTRGRVKGCCCWDPLSPAHIFMKIHANNRAAEWKSKDNTPHSPPYRPIQHLNCYRQGAPGTASSASVCVFAGLSSWPRPIMMNND